MSLCTAVAFLFWISHQLKQTKVCIVYLLHEYGSGFMCIPMCKMLNGCLLISFPVCSGIQPLTYDQCSALLIRELEIMFNVKVIRTLFYFINLFFPNSPSLAMFTFLLSASMANNLLSNRLCKVYSSLFNQNEIWFGQFIPNNVITWELFIWNRLQVWLKTNY